MRENICRFWILRVSYEVNEDRSYTNHKRDNMHVLTNLWTEMKNYHRLVFWFLRTAERNTAPSPMCRAQEKQVIMYIENFQKDSSFLQLVFDGILPVH